MEEYIVKELPYSELVKLVEKIVAEQTNPDYAESDPTKKSHILNRLCYETGKPSAEYEPESYSVNTEGYLVKAGLATTEAIEEEEFKTHIISVHLTSEQGGYHTVDTLNYTLDRLKATPTYVDGILVGCKYSINVGRSDYPDASVYFIYDYEAYNSAVNDYQNPEFTSNGIYLCKAELDATDGTASYTNTTIVRKLTRVSTYKIHRLPNKFIDENLNIRTLNVKEGIYAGDVNTGSIDALVGAFGDDGNVVINTNGITIDGKKVSADVVESVNFGYGDCDTLVQQDGIYWGAETEVQFEKDDEYEPDNVYYRAHHRVPIVAGDNVNFSVDETKHIVKINSTGGGDEVVTTTGTSSDYEATVPSITELKAGASFVMIPHVKSSTNNKVTLNVNGFGAVPLARPMTNGVNASIYGTGFLSAEKAYRVFYNGTAWVLGDYPKPYAKDLFDVVPVENGGVPTTNTSEAGKVLTTNDKGIPEWKQQSWNDIADKPFCDDGFIEVNITKDSAIDTPFGFISINEASSAYVVSLTTYTKEQLIGATVGYSRLVEIELNSTETLTEAMIVEETADGLTIKVDNDPYMYIFVAYTSDYKPSVSKNVLPVSGIYFTKVSGTLDNQCVTSLSFTVGSLVKLDEKFIPDSIARVKDIPTNPSGGIVDITIPVTYAELKALRDSNSLVAGVFYRITDYQCTSVQENTRAMDNKFDIIVRALSSNTLSKIASADYHEGDTYFANCNLSAWELKYCLDNDTIRFLWADDSGIGKGVIYYMKDEHGNECPYDFKNIQFKRMISLENGYPELDEENGEETWVYTFCGNSYHIDNDEWSELKDGSLESPYGHMSDEQTGTFTRNVIKPYIELYNGDEVRTECGKQKLNNIVLLGYWEEIDSTDDEYAYYYGRCCYNNTIGYDCRDITFGYDCSNHVLGSRNYEIIFVGRCSYNTLFNDNSFVTITDAYQLYSNNAPVVAKLYHHYYNFLFDSGIDYYDIQLSCYSKSNAILTGDNLIYALKTGSVRGYMSDGDVFSIVKIDGNEDSVSMVLLAIDGALVGRSVNIQVIEGGLDDYTITEV